MANDVIMPQMGFDMREGTVVKWLKQEGDEINRGDPIAEIETDKATVELEAFAGGVLGRIYVGEGGIVPVGAVIGVITALGEEAPEAAPSSDGNAVSATTTEAPAAPLPPAMATTSEPAASPPAPPRREGRVPVTPVARRIAEEAGVSVDEVMDNVAGSGPNGRITRKDVETYLSQRTGAPTPAAEPVPPMPQIDVGATGIIVPQGLSPMRQAIARRMSLSKLTAPHYYVTVEIDMTRAVALRQELNGELAEDERISVNDMIVKAVASTLAKHPMFNVTVLAEGLRPNPTVDISMAVALEDGLIAPSMPDTGSKSLREVALATKDIIARARSGRLRPNEMSGIGFTVSNLGMYDVKDFVAIITPPNAGAVAVGSVKATPIVKDDEVVVAQMMSATLSADHRATDGAQGAQFMNELRRVLEKPAALLL